jgi:heavy metal sensor kinase
MLMRKRSIRFRLTVWYTLVLTAGLSLFGSLAWLSLRHRLMDEVDRDLEGRASRFEAYFRNEAALATGNHLRNELREFSEALPPSSYIYLHGANGFVFSYPEEAPATGRGYRMLSGQFAVDGEHFDLEVGTRATEVRHTLDLLQLLLWSLIPVVIAIASLGGAWVSGRALKPVHDITASALTISIENLSERLPVPESGDEIARLTEVLNGMLARLESAVKTLSQFVADASHELRTPLAVIRTSTELALRRVRTPESYRDSLQSVAAETERMTKLVEDLLVLARSDTGTSEMPLAPVDLREALREVCEEMRGLSDVRGVRLKVSLGDAAAFVSGNRAALHRLFVVLLDNALKYSRPDGDVAVTMDTVGARISVAIEDRGMGISAEDLPHIFKRFYRADQARTGGGYGLGLSLAESIARAHGATIEVRSVEGSGSTFRVMFPARDVRTDFVELNETAGRVSSTI